uniref:NADH dehydrogenase subunit 6 n=1 Tax=Eophreatoicus karrkkanj TaxID=496899 RepID=D3U714_9CRUS|nr:NADH dehydrogenase subunit 6 [Eophreatoicus sp. 14 FK-2009]ACN72772.1 NADH dehydrogenase subunit 6 [Eophreatoicus karrkkanj]
MWLVGVFVSLVMVGGLIFLMCSTPFSMMIVLMVETLVVGCLVGLSKSTVWFCYILLIVFLGGVLVLFAYAVSLVAGLKVSKLDLFKMVFVFITMLMLFTVGFGDFMIEFLSFNYLYSSNGYLDSVVDVSMILNMYMYMFVVVYLFIGLLCVSSMLKKDEGPFRLM